MNTLKQPRKLSEDESIELMPTTNADGMTKVLQLLNANLPDGFYESEVSAGFFKCTEIRVKGVAYYRLVWQLTNRNDIFLAVAVTQLRSDGDFNYVGQALEILARQNGCKRVVFQTSRRAFVETAKNWGATVTGVTMEKVLA